MAGERSSPASPPCILSKDERHASDAYRAPRLEGDTPAHHLCCDHGWSGPWRCAGRPGSAREAADLPPRSQLRAGGRVPQRRWQGRPRFDGGGLRTARGRRSPEDRDVRAPGDPRRGYRRRARAEYGAGGPGTRGEPPRAGVHRVPRHLPHRRDGLPPDAARHCHPARPDSRPGQSLRRDDAGDVGHRHHARTAHDDHGRNAVEILDVGPSGRRGAASIQRKRCT